MENVRENASLSHELHFLTDFLKNYHWYNGNDLCNSQEMSVFCYEIEAAISTWKWLKPSSNSFFFYPTFVHHSDKNRTCSCLSYNTISRKSWKNYRFIMKVQIVENMSFFFHIIGKKDFLAIHHEIRVIFIRINRFYMQLENDEAVNCFRFIEKKKNYFF